MPDKDVRIHLYTDGTDHAKHDIESVSASADKLSKKIITPKIDLGDAAVKLKLKDIGVKLDILGKKVATAKADVDTSRGKAKILDFEIKLRDLGKKVARPEITVDGADHALASIYRVDAALDALSHKTARIRIDKNVSTDRNRVGRAVSGIGGLFSGLGRSIFNALPQFAQDGLQAGQSFVSGVTSAIQSAGPQVAAVATGAAITIGATLAATLGPALIAAGLGLGTALFGAIVVGTESNAKGKRQLIKPLLEDFNVIKKTITKAALVMKPVLLEIGSEFAKLFRKLGPQLREMFKASIPSLRSFANVMMTLAKNLIPAITQSLRTLNPVMPQITKGLDALVMGLVLFIRQLGPGIKGSATVFLALCRMMEGAMAALGWIIQFVARMVGDTFHAMAVIGNAQFDALRAVIRMFTRDVPNWFGDLEKGVKTAWNATFTFVRNFFREVSHDVTNWAKDFWHAITGTWDDIRNGVTGIWDKLWGWVGSRFHEFTNGAGTLATDFWHGLGHVWSELSADISGIWDKLWNWVGSRFRSLASGITSAATGLWHDITGTFRSIERDVTSIFSRTWNTLRGAADHGVNWVIDAINGLGHAWNDVRDALHLGGLGLPAWHALTPVHFASGGKVPGHGTGDTVPAMLTPGEAIVPTRLVPEVAPFLKANNVPGFAKGGLAGDSGGGPGNLGRGHLKGPGSLRGAAGARMEAGSISFGGLISDVLGAARHALVAPAVAAIHASESAARHIGFPMETEMYDALANGIITKLEGSISKKEGSGLFGGVDVIPQWFRKTFQHDPYRWGGNSTTTGADCSGATLLTYKHFGIADGMPRTAASQYDWANKIPGPVPGALVFMKGSDGTNDRSGAGHVGIAVNGSTYMSEYDTATGFRQGSYGGPHTFGLPRGWTKDRFLAKFVKGLPGGIHTGSMLADGRTIFSYLMNAIFSGHRIGAAGALASMWGESMWNPESAGTGGWGLMGWTGNFPDRRTGHPQKDMAMELPLISRFVHQFGDMGVIAQMKRAQTVLQAANLWGHGVERFGINDVHPEGLSLAKRIAGLASGGWITEPIAGVGLHTGRGYRLGERESEYVVPASKMHGAGGGTVFAPQITIQCGVGDPHAIGREVEQVLSRYGRQTGRKLAMWESR